MRYVICSTLQDPPGGLAYAAEKLPKSGFPNIDRWHIYSTETTSNETLDRLGDHKWIELRIKKLEDKLSDVDGIESDHINALRGGFQLASNSDVVHYADADRILMATTYFLGDLLASIRDTKEFFEGGYEYVNHARTNEALNSHTTPMRLTEPLVTRPYQKLIGIPADPFSTSHAFSYHVAQYLLDEGCRESGRMSYPHGKWLSQASMLFGHRGSSVNKIISIKTGMCFAYETAFALHKSILERLKSKDDLREVLINYDILSKAFSDSGIREEVEFKEWPHRVQLVEEQLGFLCNLPSAPTESKEEAGKVLDYIRKIDREHFKNLNTRDQREAYYMQILADLWISKQRF